MEVGSSEDGISSDNLDLFFKAIHNVIERFVKKKQLV